MVDLFKAVVYIDSGRQTGKEKQNFKKIFNSRFLSKSRSFSEEYIDGGSGAEEGAGRSISALEVVRNKRAKQLLAEKVIKVRLLLIDVLRKDWGGDVVG